MGPCLEFAERARRLVRTKQQDECRDCLTVLDVCLGILHVFVEYARAPLNSTLLKTIAYSSSESQS